MPAQTIVVIAICMGLAFASLAVRLAHSDRTARGKTVAHRTTDRAVPQLPDDAKSEHSSEQLWREHGTLAAQLERLERAAEVIADTRLPLPTRRSELDRAYEFLTTQIVPHLRRADEYQRELLVRRDYGRPRPRPENDEAERLTAKLGGLRDNVGRGTGGGDAPREIRRVLYEVHALTRPHFEIDLSQASRTGHHEPNDDPTA